MHYLNSKSAQFNTGSNFNTPRHLNAQTEVHEQAFVELQINITGQNTYIAINCHQFFTKISDF